METKLIMEIIHFIVWLICLVIFAKNLHSFTKTGNIQDGIWALIWCIIMWQGV